MTSFSKNTKPVFLKKGEFLEVPKQNKASKKDIDELVEISKKGQKIEERLLKSNAKTLL